MPKPIYMPRAKGTHGDATEEAAVLLLLESSMLEATARGFEPLRAEPNGFLVHHLNHSVTLSMSFVLLGMTNVEILQKQGKCGK